MRLLFFLFLFTATFEWGFANVQDVEWTEEEKAWIQAHPVVEFGYEPKWEPYEIYQKNKYTGIVGEYVRILESKTGIDFKPVPGITWVESYDRLMSGSLMMVPSCAISDTRKENLLFTEPFIIDPFVIATRHDHEFVGSLEDLIGQTITLPESYYAIDLVKRKYPGIKIIIKKTVRECLDMLSFGKADAYIGSLGVISYYINHKGFTNLKISAPTHFEDIQIAMAFPKEQHVLHGICQKVIKSISLQERSRVRKDWISVKYEYSFNWTRLLKIILIITVLVIISLIIFFLWNKSLQREIVRRKLVEEDLQTSLKKIHRQDNEKSVLLQEIHHRVKNNLQIISSMMRLQANVSDNEHVRASLSEATERVAAIALVHQKIYHSEDLGAVSLKSYLESLSAEILRSFGTDHISVTVKVHGELVGLRSIVPIALILNELITNSVKHAFNGKESGAVCIDVYNDSGKIRMAYKDNGRWKDDQMSTGFGTSLIDIFTEQLEGSYDIQKGEDGTEYRFVLTSLDWETDSPAKV